MDILVVYKKSAYELYSATNDLELKAYMSGTNSNVERMRNSHDVQKRSIDKVVSSFQAFDITYEIVYRAELKNPEVFKNKDLVVTVGGDGTVLEVSHYVNDIPVIGVNSDPNTSVGYFSCTNADNFPNVMRNLSKTKLNHLNRMVVSLDGKLISDKILNDVMVAHEVPSASTRYRVKEPDICYDVRQGYGLLVATAAGSTAAIWEEGGEMMPLESKLFEYLVRGRRVKESRFVDSLEVESLTRQAKLYLDGEHIVHPFPIGSVVRIEPGVPFKLYGDFEAKRELLKNRDLAR